MIIAAKVKVCLKDEDFFLNLVNPEAYKEIIFKQDVEAQKFISKWAVWLLPCRRIFLALEACLELGHSDLDEDPNAKYREKAIYVTTSVLSNRERNVILRTCDSVFSSLLGSREFVPLMRLLGTS